MTQQQIVTATEGTPLSNTIANFIALGLTCDNLSSSWVFLPDAGRFVPPWTASFTTPLVGTKSAVVQWQTPSGVTIPQVGTGKATLTFTDYTVPFSPGVVVTQAQPTTGSPPAVSVQPPPNLSIANAQSVSLAPAATKTVVAGVAGKTIYLYGFVWGMVPGGSVGLTFAGLESTTHAVNIDQLSYNTLTAAGSLPQVGRAVTLPGILPMPVGEGIMFDNSAASAGNIAINASVYYLQF